MPSRQKRTKKTANPKRKRIGGKWVVEITPRPSPQQNPITDDNAIEIDKWLKLVDSYWEHQP